MSTIDDGGMAFPQHGWSSNPEVLERMKACGGMTLRDWFAGQALAGLLANQELLTVVDSNGLVSCVSNWAFSERITGEDEEDSEKISDPNQPELLQ